MRLALHIAVSQLSPLALPTPIVLVVEDDPLVREMVASEIAEAGFGVIEAETAEEGLIVIEGGSASLLFTDIRLPGRLNGWQLAEHARRIAPDLPIIYATGYTDDAPRVLPGGVLIRKPYRPSEVTAHLHRLLGARTLR